MTAFHRGIPVQGKVVPICTMKAYTGSIGTAPLILNLGTKMEVHGPLHAQASLTPGKNP